MFTNEQIDVHSLPASGQLVLQPLEERYVKVLYLNAAMLWLAPVLWLTAGFIFSLWTAYPLLFWSLLALAVALATLNTVLVKPSFRVKGFAIREKDIAYQAGLLSRSLTILPFNRIQHCEITRGPLSRLLGLSNLHVFTAGGSGSDLSIPGLDAALAQDLCQSILKKVRSDEEE